MWWGGMWMMFPALFFFIMLILAPLFLWQRGCAFKIPKEESETPLEILKKHYAKGEVSKDEFEQIKKDISS
jgi:putative membrane protein